MEQFYFEEPSFARKEEIIDYINKFVEYNSNINGEGGSGKVFENTIKSL